MCFQVGAFGVNFSAAIKVAAMHPPPAVWGGIPIALVTGLPRSPTAYLPRRVWLTGPAAPQVRGVSAEFWRRRGCGSDRGAQVPRGDQHFADGVGGELGSGRELLGAVGGLTAQVRVQAVGLQAVSKAGAVESVLWGTGGNRHLGVLLFLPSQDDFGPQIFLAVELDFGG